MSVCLHGENGITFALFTELEKEEKIKDFLEKIELLNGEKLPLGNEKSFEVHLFPSFGRGGKTSGLGEPDCMIFTNDFYLFIEVKTEEFHGGDLTSIIISEAKEKKPNRIVKQLERFYFIGRLFYLDKYKNRKFIIGDRIKGEFEKGKKQREIKIDKKNIDLINKMSKIRKFYIICITTNETIPLDRMSIIISRLNLDLNSFGWIGFNSIKEIIQNGNFELTKFAFKLNDILNERRYLNETTKKCSNYENKIFQ